MISPKNMTKIQIDITNACGNICSNCTRFCGHHEKAFFMDYDTFCNAVDSLDGYEGMVGIIGGEPTLHPEFERFADYIREKRVGGKVKQAREPIEDMQRYIQTDMWHPEAKAGLWSSLTSGYYKYFETINDTFKTQLLNDHNNTCMHQALLMSRKELGIDDNEWIEKRDKCWIQNTWSATITPKGAFFCEVAGALDMLFHGPGGWPVEKGWWEREPKDFTDQLHWCEMCSGCLDVPQRISNDGHDDVTPDIYKKLMAINSPKAKKGWCIVHDPKDYDKTKYHTFTGDNDYMELGNNQRTTKENRNLYPKSFVKTSWKELGKVINNGVEDWILVSDTEETLDEAERLLSNLIINTGCIYIYNDVIAFNVRARAVRDRTDEISNGMKNIWGYYPYDKIINISNWENKSLVPVLEEMDSECKVAVYGAGVKGTALAAWFLTNNKKNNLVAWVDQNYEKLGYPIMNPETLKEVDVNYILVAIESKEIYMEVKKYLLELEIPEKCVLWLPGIYEEENCGGKE